MNATTALGLAAQGDTNAWATHVEQQNQAFEASVIRGMKIAVVVKGIMMVVQGIQGRRARKLAAKPAEFQGQDTLAQYWAIKRELFGNE